MERQGTYGGVAGTFLTFSLLLMVLAIGFMVGRVMVARMYAGTVPETQRQPVRELEAMAQIADERPLLPGSVYVPPPAPPEEPPEEMVETEGAEVEGDAGGEAAIREEAAAAPAEAAGVEEQAPAVPIAPAPRPMGPTPGSVGEGSSQARYSIQIGVFAVRGGAREVAEELGRVGYPARIEVTSTEEQALYRVLTGRYRTEYAARKALDELRREGFPGFLVEE